MRGVHLCAECAPQIDQAFAKMDQALAQTQDEIRYAQSNMKFGAAIARRDTLVWAMTLLLEARCP
jgi:hypothetical protein